MLKKLMAPLCVMACFAFLSSAATAGNFSFTGSFNQDDDIQLLYLTVATASTVTFRSYSYGSGTQADGNIVNAGGFDPVVSVFNSEGDIEATQDDDASGTVTPDPPTDPEKRWDVYLQLSLPAGDYIVAITQSYNYPLGDPDAVPVGNFSDGFTEEGNGNFTGPGYGCTNQSFCDFDGDNRTSQWAFDILGADLASTTAIVVPENVPFLPIWAMAALALSLVGIRRVQ